MYIHGVMLQSSNNGNSICIIEPAERREIFLNMKIIKEEHNFNRHCVLFSNDIVEEELTDN